jgi:hypothetical protein
LEADADEILRRRNRRRWKQYKIIK